MHTTSDSTSRSTGSHQGSNSGGNEAMSQRPPTYGDHYLAEPAHEIAGRLREYAKQKPDVAVMWCFALGLIVGWKIRG